MIQSLCPDCTRWAKRPVAWRATMRRMFVDLRRRRMHETANRAELEQARERFVAAERSMLEQRRGGSLAQAMSEPLPGESPEELRWLAIEDSHLAEERLVELRSGGEVCFKHVDDLTYDDRPARIEAENARRAWLMERQVKEAAAKDGGEPIHAANSRGARDAPTTPRTQGSFA